MTTNLDFPANCGTNVHVLNDFGEIAYIVCTLAPPPAADNSASTPSVEAVLSRLRRTERQFREAAILAALDVERRQLFTFYKKVDIANTKDQKALLAKFGQCLRDNTCAISYKAAARLPDLLKLEQSNLYRLFSIAVISSIKLVPSLDLNLQPIGHNLCLVETPTSVSAVDGLQGIKRWLLHRIDLQIVPTGHIILTVTKDERFTFKCMSTMSPLPSRYEEDSSHPSAVYLAPIGRTARLARTAATGGSVFTFEPGLDARKVLWKELLPLWFKEHLFYSFDFDGCPWVEVEVAVREHETVQPSSPENANLQSPQKSTLQWKTIYWPAQLCFLVEATETLPDQKGFGDNDPVQFVQDWMNRDANGSAHGGAKENEDGVQHDDDDDDEPLFGNDGAFDDAEHFQPFGPPAFPANQAIYPTPPDAVMTHPTPGMLSIDGIAVTPANPIRGHTDTVPNTDEDMFNYDDAPDSRPVSGYLHEDLFEDMPDDNFGQAGAGDEPNWDFFDQPGVDSMDRPVSPKPKHDGEKNGSQDVTMIDASFEHVLHTDGEPQADFDIEGVEGQTMRPPHISADAAHAASPKESSRQELEKKSAEQVTSAPEKGKVHFQENQSRSQRRRSSVYERTEGLSSSTNRDVRYATEGEFWFDPRPKFSRSSSHTVLPSAIRRTPSTSSDSGSSVGSFDMLRDSSIVASRQARLPPWTQYQPESPTVASIRGDLDASAIRQDLRDILLLLKSETIEPPVDSQFSLQEIPNQPLLTATQKLLEIAQIMFDQVSQTSLLNDGVGGVEPKWALDDSYDLLPDLSSINTSAVPSTLSQIIHPKSSSSSTDAHGKTPRSNPNQMAEVQGRIVKLPPNQISVRRAEQPFVASMAILDFWDTLNLQPGSGSKDATTFCIHPHNPAIAQGCSNLLQRMSETYGMCTLGTHGIGRIPGLTNDGLIAWSADHPPRVGLHQTCQRLGSAIASSTELRGTILVYMVCQDANAVGYLQVCSAFHNLFEAFRDAPGEKPPGLDLALQVVPLSFVASPDTLAIPPQKVFTRLAIEVYNRLPPPEASNNPSVSGSAIKITKCDPSLHFHLTPMPESPMNKNGPCLHLAYSMTLDQRWITAAWTDELGQTSWTMCFCLRLWGSNNERPRKEIFKELWDVSHDIMSRARGRWRLAVAKQGYYGAAEIADWRHVVDGATAAQKKCLLMLVSTQLRPKIRISPQSLHGKTGQFGQSSSQPLYGTPASTPQANITSPDQAVPATPTPGGSSMLNAPTPPEHGFDPNLEPDITLVDPSEESWIVMLPYGINQTTSMVEIHPAQASGLLLKRRGFKDEDGCDSIEVSLVNAAGIAPENGKTQADELLEDVITDYRGLIALGSSRGCADRDNECTPWHLATVQRGAQVLGLVM